VERPGSPEESEAEARERAEKLERDVEDMESRAEEVDRRIAETESDWESKKDAADAPGAQPSDSERNEQDDDEPASDG
jgi:hypothetical protein